MMNDEHYQAGVYAHGRDSKVCENQRGTTSIAEVVRRYLTATRVKRIFTDHDEKQRVFPDFALSQYARESTQVSKLKCLEPRGGPRREHKVNPLVCICFRPLNLIVHFPDRAFTDLAAPGLPETSNLRVE